jgi:hypothetical protein
VEIVDPIHRFCGVCGREWCTCGGPYTGTVVRLVREGSHMSENVATEMIWSEPNEMGVRTLLAAPGDPIPEDAPKAKARHTAKNKSADAEDDK